MKYIFCLYFAVLMASTLKAQEVDRVPIQYAQFFNTFSILNPASCGTRSNIEIQSARQQHGGAWKTISNTFVSASMRIRKRKANNFHVAGLSFISDKEGQYLKRTNLFLTYAWHTRLTKKLSLSAGASAGFFSYQVGGSNANVAASDQAPDASIGMWLYSEKGYAGISMNQVLNSEVTPLEETTRLFRHYNFTAGYSFKVTSALRFMPKVQVRHVPGHNTDLDLAAIGVLNEIIAVGVSYRNCENLVPLFGFEKLPVGKGYFKAMLSYAVPIGKIADNIQTYELTLSFDFKPDKKSKK